MIFSRYFNSLRFLIIALVCAMGLAVGFTSCIEDGISSAAADQPEFSVDTVQLGTLFTGEPSPTHRFIVYNRHKKGINISSIRFVDDSEGNFRLNVDGHTGREFSNVEIRANDSIFVFVEATLPQSNENFGVELLGHIEFMTNGVTQIMPVKATGRDAVRLQGDTRITADMSLSSEKPYQVYDSIVVEPNVTLTIPAGTELYFHDSAELVVHGTLKVEGTAEKPVNMTGDRFGYVAAQIPYEIMSGQWGGVYFSPSSKANLISHASIRNSNYGVMIDNVEATEDCPSLTMVNTQVRNTKAFALEAYFSDLLVVGCELSDASLGVVLLDGGNHTFNHCTFANYYLFTALGGPAVQLWHLNSDYLDPDTPDKPLMTAKFSNCIIYGLGNDISHGDLTGTGVIIDRCLFKSPGTDDDNFLRCIWETDPLYYTVREDYLFDYRLQPDSPAAEAGDPELTHPLTAADRYGIPRSTAAPSLGAYQFVAPE